MKNTETKYVIVKKRHYYPGTFNVDKSWSIVEFYMWPHEDVHGLNDDWFSFNSKQDALNALKERDSGTYYLAHGEYSRPEYKVLSINHSIVKGALNKLER